MDKSQLLELKNKAEQQYTELSQQYTDLGTQRDTVLTENVRVQGDIRTYEKLIALLEVPNQGDPDAPNPTD